MRTALTHLVVFLVVIPLSAAFPAAGSPTLEDLIERQTSDGYGWKDGVMTSLLGDRPTLARSLNVIPMGGHLLPDSHSDTAALDDLEILLPNLDDLVGVIVQGTVLELGSDTSALDEALPNGPEAFSMPAVDALTPVDPDG